MKYLYLLLLSLVGISPLHAAIKVDSESSVSSATSAGYTGWQDNGTSVTLIAPTDLVGIGQTPTAGVTFIVGVDTSPAIQVSTGQIGINTSVIASGAAVHIASNVANVIFHMTNGNTGITATDGLDINLDASNGRIWLYDTRGLQIGTSNTQRMVILSGGNIGVGNIAPVYKLHVASGGVHSDGTSAGFTISTSAFRVGIVEGADATVNHLIQYGSATVNGSAAIDFTDAGLRDYAATPFVIVTPVFDSDGNTQLVCNPHTVSTTGMTIECTMNTGDGVAQTVAADATNRQVNYILMLMAP